MIAMGFASFSNDLAMPGAWGACMDVGGKYAGTLSGTMNMMGNFGGALSPVVIGYVLQTNRELADSFLRILHDLFHGHVLLDGRWTR